LVAVVPVISKADTHTALELEAYRREVLQVKMTASSRAEARCKLSDPRHTGIPHYVHRHIGRPFQIFRSMKCGV
jgi:hypothetical protein